MDKNKTYQQLLSIRQQLSEMEVFPALGWVLCFDILYDIWDNNQYKDVKDTEWVDECVPEGISFRTIFDKFCDDIDSLGIGLDLGGEIIEEVLHDWMRDNGFLVRLDEDGWLE